MVRVNIQREGSKGEALSSSTSQEDSGKLQIVMKLNSYEMIIWWSTEDSAYVVDVLNFNS